MNLYILIILKVCFTIGISWKNWIIFFIIIMSLSIYNSIVINKNFIVKLDYQPFDNLKKKNLLMNII